MLPSKRHLKEISLMRKDAVMLETMEFCLKIEHKAMETYKRFSRLERNPGLKKFWQGLAADEKTHLGYWKRIFKLSKQGLTPPVFENVHKSRVALKKIDDQIGTLINQTEQARDTKAFFTITCWLEFYMLNPEYSKLLHFLQSLLVNKSPEDDYEEHLNKLIKHIRKYSGSAELELIGETIGQMWSRNRELIYQSNTDSLTGLFNRRGFFQAIIPMAYFTNRKKVNSAMMIIDIDNFKKINDTHGHQAGDKIIRFVADRIKSSARHSNIASRHGGDEFLVYLPEVNREKSNVLGLRIIDKIKAHNKHGIPVTVSIGIAQKTIGGDIEKDINLLIRKADENLYQAKKSGRNRLITGVIGR